MGNMPMPQRTPEHDKLNFMVGEWKVREVHSPSPFMPQGGTGEGRTSIKWIVSNLVLTNDYHSKGSMGDKFEGYGLFTYDAQKKNYVHYWFDSVAPCGMSMHGYFEASDLIFQGEHETPGGKMKMRMVSHPVSKDEWTFTMNMDMGGKMVPMLTITHVRA